MTDPRIPAGPREQEPAGPIPPQRDDDHQARQLARTLTAGAWLAGVWEDTNNDDC
ncbi:MAG TPA: hypothetical protein VF880_18305 [Actinomycetes bacterium]|jgi:hypothetical protein